MTGVTAALPANRFACFGDNRARGASARGEGGQQAQGGDITPPEFGKPEKAHLQLGFIPLTDCAPLALAKEDGHFERYGLSVELHREVSWANIRDKVVAGEFDGAQMLAPMPLAATLGLGGLRTPMVTAVSLSLNGNAIIISSALSERLMATGLITADDPLSWSRALAAVTNDSRDGGAARLRFAAVYPYSKHYYELRQWLALGGTAADHDVELLIVPPPSMVACLANGDIDGFCVGEPWGSLAVARGLGRVVASSHDLWPCGPEKVLGVTRQWAEQYPGTHLALVMALLEAMRGLDQPPQRERLVTILAGRDYLDLPGRVVSRSLVGPYAVAADAHRSAAGFHRFEACLASFPWRSHALWLLGQMKRWGQLPSACEPNRLAADVYRPKVYRRAAHWLDMPAPLSDWKPEGAHHRPYWLATTKGPLQMPADRCLSATSRSLPTSTGKAW